SFLLRPGTASVCRSTRHSPRLRLKALPKCQQFIVGADQRTGVGKDYTGERETHGTLSTRRQADGISEGPLAGDRTMPSWLANRCCSKPVNKRLGAATGGLLGIVRNSG